MKFKRFLAFTVVATMVAGSTLTAFAEEGITGAGIIEYDDSKDILYDSVTVPTLAVTDYSFTLDPQQKLVEYGGDGYDSTASVFFPNVKAGEKAKLTVKAGESVYKASYATVAATDSKWDGIVATATEGLDGSYTYTVNAGFYVWVPDKLYTGKAVSGYSGKYEEITATNVTDWFDVDSNKKISLKADYKAGEKVCDGKVYQISYTAVTGGNPVTITDSDEDPISNYYNVVDDTPVISNLYTRSGDSAPYTYTLATTSVLTYTAATPQYKGETKHVYITNKSTKAKTLTIKVTLNNADGLTIKANNTFTGDANASIYVAATEGADDEHMNTTALAAADGKVTATLTASLAAATDAGATTYQSTDTNEITGGHKYYRYSGPAPTYVSNKFYITAIANTEAGSKAKWDEYYASLTAADKVPTLSIVYTLKNDDNTETGPDAGEETPSGDDTPAVTAKTGTASVLPYGGKYYLGLKGEGGASFTANATSVMIGEVDVTTDAELLYGYIAIESSKLTAKGVNVGAAFDVTYVVDGETYAATYTP